MIVHYHRISLACKYIYEYGWYKLKYLLILSGILIDSCESDGSGNYDAYDHSCYSIQSAHSCESGNSFESCDNSDFGDYGHNGE